MKFIIAAILICQTSFTFSQHKYVAPTDPLVLKKLEQWQDLEVWSLHALGHLQPMGNR